MNAVFPEAHVFTPDAGEPALRWGILGPGWIAGEFCASLQANTIQRAVAVGSRSRQRAEVFAQTHGLPHALTADELVCHPDVDVVYIATPPTEHVEPALAAIAAGKHVLIEKPFTATADEARRISEAARAAGVLAMEAMWARYLPQASVMRTLLDDGALGEVTTVTADHGQAINPPPDHRLSRPEIGGGSLLDLGIYPIAFATWVLGDPLEVHAAGELTDLGVDAHASLAVRHAHGASSLACSMVARTPTTASICGDRASLLLAANFYNPTTLTLVRGDAELAHWDDPTGLRGFDALSWQATAFAGYVAEGRVESPLQPHAENIANQHVIDLALAQIRAAHLERNA